ncbi:MAG TPA: polysaccharide deacetylase family protein, partial [Gammaproteobacteria bacterium]|nr:polysaccharide deacetylase family protein [Gammaproteobacteria bacterium]
MNPAVLAARRKVAKLGPPAQGALVLTLDDGYASWASDVLPALSKYPYQHATFNVITGGIGTSVTSATIADLYARGHEIGSHTVTHPHMPSLTPAQRQTEYDDSKTALEAIVGAGNVRLFTYPYDDRNQTTDQEAYLRYERVFGSVAPIIHNPSMPGRFVYSRLNWLTSNHTSILDAVRQAATKGHVLILYTHDPGNSSGGFATDPTVAQFEELLALAHTLGLPMLTASEALEAAPSLVVNPGFDNGLAGWQFVNHTAVGNAVSVEAGGVFDTANDLYSPGILKMVQGTGLTMQVKQFVPVIPGVEHEFSFRYKMDAGGAALQHVVTESDAYGAQISNLISGPNTDTTWGRTQRVWTAAANAAYVSIQWYLSASTTARVGHVWYGPTGTGQLG